MANSYGTSPVKRTNVKYNQHFPKDFIKPYGAAADIKALRNDDIYQRRLKSFTCEWLQRPGIALSEMADTIDSNDYSTITKDLGVLQNSRLKSRFLAYLDKLKELIHPFNSKLENFRALDMNDTSERLKSLQREMSYSAGNDMIKSYIEQMMVTGASMYLSAVHLRVAMYVLNNLTQVAGICGCEHNLKAFSKDPRIETYAGAIYADLRIAKTVTTGDSSNTRDLASYIVEDSDTDVVLPITGSSSSLKKKKKRRNDE